MFNIYTNFDKCYNNNNNRIQLSSNFKYSGAKNMPKDINEKYIKKSKYTPKTKLINIISIQKQPTKSNSNIPNLFTSYNFTRF
jgi:hypothetical protein